jgi:hypothetical protein
LTDFTPYMGEIAKMAWGEPNRALSSKIELRFGKQGSRSVDLKKGTWFDHEAKEGGGVLDLIARETGRKGQEAIRWLKENGFEVDERGPCAIGRRRSR